MSDDALANQIGLLGLILGKEYGPLTFTMMEVGAVPLPGQSEPAHELLSAFPGSTIIAFEIDAALCDSLNQKARPGLRYFPVALGRTEEKRPLYQTRHPMCASLYQPNEELLGLYNNLEMAMLESVSSIETVSLDHFIKTQDLAAVDFIKIDIQGAELDVFKGGVDTLGQTLAIVSEVEFVSLYVGQPLFGDVSAFLIGQDFQFHKFLGFGGRALKPLVLNNDPHFAVQHLWADAMFIRDIRRLTELVPERLLKLGVLAVLYRSPDVAFCCFRRFDENNGTNLCQAIFGGPH